MGAGHRSLGLVQVKPSATCCGKTHTSERQIRALGNKGQPAQTHRLTVYKHLTVQGTAFSSAGWIQKNRAGSSRINRSPST